MCACDALNKFCIVYIHLPCIYNGLPIILHQKLMSFTALYVKYSVRVSYEFFYLLQICFQSEAKCTRGNLLHACWKRNKPSRIRALNFINVIYIVINSIWGMRIEIRRILTSFYLLFGSDKNPADEYDWEKSKWLLIASRMPRGIRITSLSAFYFPVCTYEKSNIPGRRYWKVY